MSWAHAHQARSDELSGWRFSAIVLLRELQRLADRRKITQSECDLICMKANPDCSWGNLTLSAASRSTIAKEGGS